MVNSANGFSVRRHASAVWRARSFPLCQITAGLAPRSASRLRDAVGLLLAKTRERPHVVDVRGDGVGVMDEKNELSH